MFYWGRFIRLMPGTEHSDQQTCQVVWQGGLGLGLSWDSSIHLAMSGVFRFHSWRRGCTLLAYRWRLGTLLSNLLCPGRPHDTECPSLVISSVCQPRAEVEKPCSGIYTHAEVAGRFCLVCMLVFIQLFSWLVLTDSLSSCGLRAPPFSRLSACTLWTFQSATGGQG